ncbi:MAG: glutamate--tRNA ligase family protein [Bacteroidota bacterium]
MNASVTDQFVQPLFRIAPTPSGFIHRGNAANFLLIWLFARIKKGKLLLRIDDLDRERMRPEYLSDIFRSLEKLGIDYDHGPAGPDDFTAHWSQFVRMDLYRDALHTLKNKPESYSCACSRGSLNKDKTCACKSALSTMDPDSCNFKITLEVDPSRLRNDFFSIAESVQRTEYRTDLVFMRKSGQPAYHTASIVDDVHFGVTHLVRGEDLIESSIYQLALAAAMRKVNYLQVKHAHHPLVRSNDGEKLAKSAGKRSIQKPNHADWSPDQISMLVSKWLDLGSIGNKEELFDAANGSAVGANILQW